MREKVQTEMARAFESGGADELLAQLPTMRQSIIDQLASAGITGADEMKRRAGGRRFGRSNDRHVDHRFRRGTGPGDD